MPAAPPPASRRADRLALLAAAGLFVALSLFGARYHWVEEAGTAERDGFVAEAEQIQAGSLPHDAFRPLLYPLAVVAVAPLAGSPFAAARLLSNLAAAALAWSAYGLGRRLGGAAAGAWAMALTAVNPNLWILGQHVTTDMSFAALAAAALAAALTYLERPTVAAALAAGAAYGLAAFTRGNALFLLPGLALAWWLASGARGRRLAHVVAGGGLAILLLVPHWTLRWMSFGNPFHDENWKNLAFKLYGFPDWSYLDRVPFDGALAVVRADPGAVVRGGLEELGRLLAGGSLASLLGTWLHLALLAVGTALLLRRRPRAAGWLLFALSALVIATAFSFFAWGRLLLVLIPAANALGVAGWLTLSPRAAPALWHRAVAVGAALSVALLAVKTAGFRLPDFIRRHPYVEVATLQQLDHRLRPGDSLAGTSPFLGRYLEHEYVYVPDAFGSEVSRPALYFERLRPLLAARHAAYLVAGRVDLRDRPASLLAASPPVPWLAPAGGERGVAVWEVTGGEESGGADAGGRSGRERER